MKRLLLALVLLSAVSIAAQQGDGLEKGFAADKVYDFEGVDSINTFNGNLTLSIPMGPSYPVNGGLSYHLALSYNSKVWDYEGFSGQMRALPNRRSDAGMGWLVSLGRLVPPANQTNDTNQWIYESPDGNEHIFFDDKLHASDNLTPISAPVTAVRYSRDGTYLRLLTRSDGTTDLEFPNGDVHTFNTATGYLTTIRDIPRTVTIPGRTANTVTVSYLTSPTGTPCPVSNTWIWQITDSQNARSNYVCFKSMTTPESIYSGIVDRVILAAPPTSTGTARTASYVFNHTPTTVQRGCHSNVPVNQQTIANVPLLTSLSLPNGSEFQFTYNTSDTGVGTCDRGTLQTLTLPTGATTSYAYRYFTIPDAECSRLTFNTRIVGVGSRTIFHDNLPTATWTYSSSLSSTPGSVTCELESGPVATDPPPEEMTVKVTDPLNQVTEHYYSVWPGVSGFSSPNGFRAEEYGLPLTRKQSSTFSTGTTTQSYLSRRVYTATGYAASPKVPLRSTYVTYESDVASCAKATQTCKNSNSRLTREQVVYHDDGDRKAETAWTRFDGLGNYRKINRGGTFAGTNASETVIAYNTRDSNVNPTTGLDTADYVPGGTFTPPSSSTPWVLDTSSSIKMTQGTTTVTKQSCYDANTGFLRATRAVSTTAPGGQTTDSVVVYGADANGNVTSETFFGGDVLHNAPVSPLCGIAGLTSLPTADVRIDHTYEWGVRKTSQYAGASFLHLDRTIDRYTGLTLATNDTSGLTTTYGYYAHFGIQTVQPPGMAATTITHFNSGVNLNGFTPARVRSSTTSAGLGTAQSEYQYDPLGRLWRTKSYMANGTWSGRETNYDAVGNVISISEPATIPTLQEYTWVPTFKTTFSGHDPFGRPGASTTPDQKTITFSYKGDSERKRTMSIAGISGPENISTTETYDRKGRLIKVSAGQRATDPAESETTYTYDVLDRLVKVEMPGPNGTQERAFTYDYRGFLTQEKHPEIGASGNGIAEYLEYDSRGRARRKKVGTSDIRMTLDSAERITEVKDIGITPNRTLKLFDFDDPSGALYGQCSNGRCNGKLAAAARFNYVPDLGTVAVSESYQYDGVGGRVSRRDRVVGDSDVLVGGQPVFRGQAFFSSQAYDAFGDLASIIYPCRAGTGLCEPSERIRQVSFTRTNGLLTAVPNYASEITYQPSGLIDTVTHGSGSSAVLERWTPDDWGMGRPKTIRALTSTEAELWSSGNYAYDGSGNVSQIGATVYHYDALNRLSTRTLTGTGGGYDAQSRAYDVHGNYLYTSVYGCGPMINGHQECYNTGVLALELNGTTNRYADLTYDSRGNVTNDYLRAFSYDPLNATTSASVDGREFRYIYTADDERIAAVERKVVSGSIRNRTTWTLRGLDSQLLSVWTDDATSGTRIFTWKEDEIWRGAQLLANETASGTRHYTLDHLGTPRLVTNSAGTIIGTQSFEPFGSGGSSDGGALQFTAQERDAATLGNGSLSLPDYMHARYYDLNWGRFLSVDPVLNLGQATRSPQDWNRYAYVINNPLTYADPTGRVAELPANCANANTTCKELKDLRNSVPPEMRIYVQVVVQGGKVILNANLLNTGSRLTKSDNFLALRQVANSPATVEFRSSVMTFQHKSGGAVNTLTFTRNTPENAFYGITLSVSESVAGKRQVFVNPTMNDVDRAATAAHELYGHMRRYLLGLPWEHEPVWDAGRQSYVDRSATGAAIRRAQQEGEANARRP
jgi:RHS repeat-associated protein